VITFATNNYPSSYFQYRDCRVVLCREIVSSRAARIGGRIETSHIGSSDDGDGHLHKRHHVGRNGAHSSTQQFYMRDFHAESITAMSQQKYVREKVSGGGVDAASSVDSVDSVDVVETTTSLAILTNEREAKDSACTSDATAVGSGIVPVVFSFSSPTQCPPCAVITTVATSTFTVQEEIVTGDGAVTDQVQIEVSLSSEDRTTSITHPAPQSAVTAAAASCDSVWSEGRPSEQVNEGKRKRKHRHSKHRHEKTLVESDFDFTGEDSKVQL
jgi:hypothetical protein